MDVDLSHQHIVELTFSLDTSSEKEREVAQKVTRLNAVHNRIRILRGLSLLFSNLCELYLAHNKLGVQCKAPRDWMHLVDNSSTEVCEGIPPWILALPPTIRLLDVSDNSLVCFSQCRCSSSGASKLVSDVPPSDLVVRKLRHISPTSVHLFFPKSNFPMLDRLVLSYNDFSCSVAECREREGVWHRQHVPKQSQPATTSAVRYIDLSFNREVKCANSFLLAFNSDPEHSSLEQVSLEGCGLQDLFGISAVAQYAPNLKGLVLRSTPFATSVLSCCSVTEKDLLRTVLPSLTTEAPVNHAAIPTQHVSAAVEEVVSEHFDVFHSFFAKYSNDRRGMLTLSSCLYTILVFLVVPQITHVDMLLSTAECRTAILTAFYETVRVVLSDRRSQLVKPHFISKGVVDLSSVASAWDPTGRWQRIALSASEDEEEDTSSGDEPQTAVVQTHHTSTPPIASDREIAEMQHQVEVLRKTLTSKREAERVTGESVLRLEKQLTSDRECITEQRKAILALQEKERKSLEDIERHRERLQKSRREMANATAAIEAKRKKEAKSRKEAGRRSTPKASVLYKEKTDATPLHHPKNRSEVFREVFSRGKMERFKETHPFSYSPSRFKSDGRSAGSSPSGVPYGTDASSTLTDEKGNANPNETLSRESPLKRQFEHTVGAAVVVSPTEPAANTSGCAASDPFLPESLSALLLAGELIKKKHRQLRGMQREIAREMPNGASAPTREDDDSIPVHSASVTGCSEKSNAKQSRNISVNRVLFA